MPDYSACKNPDCKKSKTCARFLMKTSSRQSYLIFPKGYDGHDCKDYWPVDKDVPFALRERRKREMET